MKVKEYKRQIKVAAIVIPVLALILAAMIAMITMPVPIASGASATSSSVANANGGVAVASSNAVANGNSVSVANSNSQSNGGTAISNSNAISSNGKTAIAESDASASNGGTSVSYSISDTSKGSSNPNIAPGSSGTDTDIVSSKSVAVSNRPGMISEVITINGAKQSVTSSFDANANKYTYNIKPEQTETKTETPEEIQKLISEQIRRYTNNDHSEDVLRVPVQIVQYNNTLENNTNNSTIDKSVTEIEGHKFYLPVVENLPENITPNDTSINANVTNTTNATNAADVTKLQRSNVLLNTTVPTITETELTKDTINVTKDTANVTNISTVKNTGNGSIETRDTINGSVINTTLPEIAIDSQYANESLTDLLEEIIEFLNLDGLSNTTNATDSASTQNITTTIETNATQEI